MERDPLTPRSRWLCHGYTKLLHSIGKGYVQNWHAVVNDRETRWYRCTCSPNFRIMKEGSLKMMVPRAVIGSRKEYGHQTRWSNSLSNMKSYLRRYKEKSWIKIDRGLLQ